jgi:hypothetical protein
VQRVAKGLPAPWGGLRCCELKDAAVNGPPSVQSLYCRVRCVSRNRIGLCVYTEVRYRTVTSPNMDEELAPRVALRNSYSTVRLSQDRVSATSFVLVLLPRGSVNGS